jgi:hypothetical protein
VTKAKPDEEKEEREGVRLVDAFPSLPVVDDGEEEESTEPPEREPTPRGQLRPEWRVFCHAYADPTSPGYANQGRAYQTAFPNCTIIDHARQAAWRLLKKKCVQDEITRIRLQIRGAADLSLGDYMQLLVNRERYFTERGGKGDAMAAAACLKMIGEASGFFIKKFKDETPPERRLATGTAAFTALAEAYERVQRMKSPLAKLQQIAEVSGDPVAPDDVPR